jgi:hypothetical protein
MGLGRRMGWGWLGATRSLTAWTLLRVQLHTAHPQQHRQQDWEDMQQQVELLQGS